MTGLSSAQSSNADLSSLVPGAGTLTPAFDSGTTEYTAIVTYATDSMTVTPTAADAAATITVNGDSVTSGDPSAAISLSVGPNVITTEVTAKDLTTKTYTLTVTRANPAVIYEPFADSNSTLTGNTPGIGLTGTWSASATWWPVP